MGFWGSTVLFLYEVEKEMTFGRGKRGLAPWDSPLVHITCVVFARVHPYHCLIITF